MLIISITKEIILINKFDFDENYLIHFKKINEKNKLH